MNDQEYENEKVCQRIRKELGLPPWQDDMNCDEQSCEPHCCLAHPARFRELDEREYSFCLRKLKGLL